MNTKGYLEGREMATTFNMLRANDLIWSFVVNNYLLGKSPFPFDLLYWNADSTRMPAAMHSFYLRNMYQENLLVKPGGITLDGVPIDLRKIKTPSFLLSTREDHIAPWRSTYAATQIYRGRSNSCCPPPATSPASSIRRAANTAIGRTTKTRRRPEEWLATATATPIPGGRYGSAGFRNTPAARCRRATPATASSNRSRTRPAPTSRCAPRVRDGRLRRHREEPHSGERRPKQRQAGGFGNDKIAGQSEGRIKRAGPDNIRADAQPVGIQVGVAHPALKVCNPCAEGRAGLSGRRCRQPQEMLVGIAQQDLGHKEVVI